MRDTLPEIWKELMKAPSLTFPCCPICGRPGPLEKHHMVKRSAGKMFRDGREMKKPTITICGFGNNLKDADGAYYCHGLAHANRLHFKWVETRSRMSTSLFATRGGHVEYLITDEPVKYEKALEMDGWRRLNDGR